MAKILIVDDEPDMIWAISNLLLTQNHSVVSVNSGEDAIKKVEETFLDLVLLDFRLPGMDGVQILERIKQIKPDLPVIMVTGYGGIEEAVQSIKLGAAHYIAKPFDNDHLIEITNKALQLNSLKKEGVFGKRIVEKIDPKLAETKPAAPAPKEPLVSPVKNKSLGLKIWAGLASLLMIAGAAGSYLHFKKNQAVEFPIHHSKVSGLSFGRSNLWACDWFSQSIYQYEFKDRELDLVKNYTMPGYHFTGIAWAEDALYTCDSWKKEIYKHAVGETLPIVAVYKSPGTNPSGLFYDGKYLWSCDGNQQKIYQHALDDQLTVLSTYDSVSRFPVGLYKEGADLWYAGTGGIIYRHSLQDGFRLEKSFEFLDNKETHQISAFTIRDGKIWTAQEGVSKIFERNLKDLPQE